MAMIGAAPRLTSCIPPLTERSISMGNRDRPRKEPKKPKQPKKPTPAAG
jgi:hypothetical protein